MKPPPPNGPAKLVLSSNPRQRQPPRTLAPGDAELATFEGIVETSRVGRRHGSLPPRPSRGCLGERVRCEVGLTHAKLHAVARFEENTHGSNITTPAQDHG